MVKDRSAEANRRASWGGGPAVPDVMNAHTFGAVYITATLNANFYEAEVKPLVDCVVRDGNSVAIMTYGRPGTGKTFTMMGGPGDGNGEGMVALAIRDLCATGASLVQVHVEEVRDLLLSLIPACTVCMCPRTHTYLLGARGRPCLLATMAPAGEIGTRLPHAKEH